MYSSVLGMRMPLTGQPFVDEAGDVPSANGNGEKDLRRDILQFNGELYNEDIEGNDTRYFYDMFQSKKDEINENMQSEMDSIIEAIGKLQGEYAFTYLTSQPSDMSKQRILFARDPIGRRSLMYAQSKETGELLITSSMTEEVPGTIRNEIVETVGGSVYCAELNGTFQEIKYVQYPFGKANRIYDWGRSVSEVSSYTNDLYRLLLEGVNRRVQHIPSHPLPTSENLEKITECRLAILFSGGIDCTLLACLCDELLPPEFKIDLLNVAFDNPRTKTGYNTPDRKLGRRSWNELNRIHRQRYDIEGSENTRFRFVEIDISYEETVRERPHVQGLIWPKDSVMDVSIAIAFYFAARGKGTLFNSLDSNTMGIPNYTSAARVLLSGLGADELYGGYTRHTRSFLGDGSNKDSDSGLTSFAEELDLDFGRLDSRNLGRDDRVCCTWGREVRYPFLDEHVVHWSLDLPLDMKMRYEGPLRPSVSTSVPPATVAERELVGKYILRQLALNLGLDEVAREKKRAIQFGAKSAKMEIGSGKVKGTERFL